MRGWFFVAVVVSLSGCIGGHATLSPRASGGNATVEEPSPGAVGAGNETLPWNEVPWSDDSTAAEPGPGEGQPKEPDDAAEDEPEEPAEPDEPGLLGDEWVGASGTGALGGIEDAVEDGGEADESVPDGGDAMNGINSTAEKTTGNV